MSRSVKKGPFIEKSLYMKVIEMNKESDKKMIKTYSRCSTIIPEMVETLSVFTMVSHGFLYTLLKISLATSSANLLQLVRSRDMAAQTKALVLSKGGYDGRK